MSVLLAVVASGSLSGAGRKLGMPLATISLKVSDLEGHLGARLLIRSSRRLDLTDAGRGYVAACQRILEQVDEAERAAAGEYRAPRGELVIAAPVVFGRLHVPPAVTAFLAAYPDIAIRITWMTGSRTCSTSISTLRSGSASSGTIVTSPSRLARCGALSASPSYVSIRGTPATPEALVEHDSIAFASLFDVSRRLAVSGKEDWTAWWRSSRALVVSTAEAAIDAAIAGLGVTRVLSYQIADARSAGRLQTVLEAFEPPVWPVSRG